MCGLAGIISEVQPAFDLIAAVKKMTDALAHRGPDGQGVQIIQKTEPAVVFGHRRLAIIDLSPGGAQPMEDVTTGQTIIFNGEIYNYRDLRQELLSHDHKFVTESDTEVILKAYAEWGTACTKHLRGMFAFAIWDPDQQQLFLARDHLGIKPLYYSTDAVSKGFIFASEVRAILASGGVSRRLDPGGLNSYLRFGSVQEPNTLVAGVRSLGPGCQLIWRSGNFETETYWQPTIAEPVYTGLPKPNVIREALFDAVSAQLVADVPVGAFLSGGIDSAAIVALMKKARSDVRTFSIIFDEPAYDERKHAREASEFIGSEHTELRLTGEMVRADLDQALHAYDQPSIDGLNTYYVSRLTREVGVTVSLSGVGGDELFGGYDGYARHLMIDKWANWLAHFPFGVRNSAASILNPLANFERGRRLVDLLTTREDPYFLGRQLFNNRQIFPLLSIPLSQVHLTGDWLTRSQKLSDQSQLLDPINRVSVLEMQTYMLSTLLRDTDQMSMAHALEVRVPLIDHCLVEAILPIQGQFKIDPHTSKPLLTRPLKGILPAGLSERSKKGFTFPFEVWLKAAMGSRLKAVMTNQQSLHPIFNANGVENLWAQFQANRISWSRIWAVFMLNHWLYQHEIRI